MGKMFDTIYQDCFAINVIDGVVKSVLPVMSRYLPFWWSIVWSQKMYDMHTYGICELSHSGFKLEVIIMELNTVYSLMEQLLKRDSKNIPICIAGCNVPQYMHKYTTFQNGLTMVIGFFVIILASAWPSITICLKVIT